MSKLRIVDPMALAGFHYGYNRPLDRHDFNGGPIPDRIGRFVLAEGELRRFANVTGMPSMATSTDTWSIDATQELPLGTMAVTKDGRVFRYAQAGAADLVAGNLLQSAVPIPFHLALTSAAQAIGDGGQNAPIVVTPGATAGAANLYSEGLLVVDTTPGNGLSYRISGHAAIVASTAFNLFLDPDERIQVALTTASRYGLHHNPYKNVLQTPTTNTAFNCGGAQVVITAALFGWIQTRGSFAGLINGTPAVSTGLVQSVTTAGAFDVAAVAAEVNVRIIARAMQVGVSGKNNRVFLMLD